jgi:hypothetical protein
MRRFQRNGNGATQAPPKQENKSKVVHRLYYRVRGGTLSVTVWERVNKGKNGDFETYTVTLQQSFQSGDKREWTNFIAEDAMPAASIGLAQAYQWLASQAEEQGGEEPQQ